MKKDDEGNKMNERGKVEHMGDRSHLHTIHFKHSEQSGLPSKSSSHELHSNDSVTQYLNPGDIYVYKKAIADSVPVKLADDEVREAQREFKKSVHFKSHHTTPTTPHAFSGVVMERNPVAIANEGAATKVKESKRETVSKFKLSRKM
ncbi:PREDICTED: uncharacterized protein LOC109583972 [Amphimedon queenslandica]|uniref:Uncharacterized protein n=1 Tax=Amphimedon queenslandica TaxID=400682 RepID=A0AAN0JDG9_AMPQE|nr:PREDICTED: uncharacterized protein LOC109583972 [Amphimedon queenslandica]|eukprot:XP_019855075.1 PREDICTED: uncharacterized protein LOC109583972 [Amphimedon queenslandica]